MRKPNNLISEGLIGLAVGASSFMNGCEEPQGRYNDNQQQRNDAGQAGLDLLQFTLGLYGVAGDGTSQQRNAAGFTSNLIGEEKRDEAIRKSGTTVNVYNDRRGNQNNSNRGFSTAFNYWIDENGDGYASPNELKGARDTFYLSRDRQVTFGSFISGRKDGILEFYLYCKDVNGNNRVVSRDKFSIPTNKYIIWVPCNSNDLLQNWAKGECIVNFWVDNVLTDSYYVNFFD